MNKERIQNLNKVEIVKCEKPDWTVKEGEIIVECTAKADKNLILRASLSDYKVVWFSNTKWDDEETLTGIMQILIDEVKEANANKETAEMSSILEQLDMPYSSLEDGFCLNARLYLNYFRDFKGIEHTYVDNTAKYLANQLIAVLSENKERANMDSAELKKKLEILKRDIEQLTGMVTADRIFNAYYKAKKMYDEVCTLRCAVLSDDNELCELYEECGRMFNIVYHHYVSFAK